MTGVFSDQGDPKNMISSSRVRHLLPVWAFLASVSVGASCSNSGGAPVTVTVTPAPANVLTCSTTQFNAVVLNTTDVAVDWSVMPASGAGTIDIQGNYQAPNATPAAPNNSVTVTAQREGNPSQLDTTPPFTLATAFPSTASPITGSTGDLEGGNPAIGVYQHAAASSGSRVYATWSVNPESATEVKMMIARSDDGGATWGTAVPAIDATISDTNGGEIDCPAVTVDAGNPDIVYAIGMVQGNNSITHALGDPTNNPAFVLAVSTDGGQHFSNTVLSTAYAGISPCQDVSSPAPNTVVVNAPTGDQCGTYPDITVWTDTAGGAGFKTGQTNDSGYYWADGISTALYVLRGTTDCTTDLSAEANASQDSSGQVIESPRMFTDGLGRLCLTYAGEPQANPTIENVYIQCSNDAGKTYTQPLEIDPNLGDDNQPSGAFGPGGMAAVVWTRALRETSDQQLYLSVSPDGGATFGTPILVPTAALPYSPSVYIDEGGIIWISYMMSPNSSTYALFVDKSCDKGATFSGAVQIQGNTSFGVIAPSLLGSGAAAPILVGLEDTQHVAYSLSP
jgi:hypothetical protein